MCCKLIVAGRIGKAPESRVLQSGTALTRFSVAADLGEKDKDGNWLTEWTAFDAWNKTAEFIRDNVGKGDLVWVEAVKKTTKKDDKYFTNYTVRDFKILKKNKSEPQTSNEPPAVSDEEVPF